MGTILLYYKYVEIEYPEAIKKWQTALCKGLGLTGRILLAHEGINGTVAGSDEACEAYVQTMNQHPLFKNIDFKTAPGDATAFPKLKVKVKEEIVHLGLDTKKVTTKDGGKHLTPEQTHELLSNPPKDLVILDTRNNYESAVGTFAGSLTPNIRYFRDFPKYIDENLDKFKDKTVLMHCTGGVRCERATAVLVQKNVSKQVYQVEGGIHRYIEKYPDGYFRGSNYVFDSRITVKVNDDILGKCHLCTKPYDQYINCLNALCNKHCIACPECIEKYNKTCSVKCQQLVKDKKVAQRPERQAMCNA